MKATNKATSLDSFFTQLLGKSRSDLIGNGECATCSNKDLTRSSFLDEMSIKEYTISGMCQTCQDVTFDHFQD